MKFFKYFLATLAGSLVALLLMLFIVAGIFGSMASLGDQPVVIRENTVLKIELHAAIAERAPERLIPSFDFLSLQTQQVMGLNRILSAIRNAKDDSRIKGVYLNLTTVSAGYATVEEIRNALADFKESGKFIVSYSDFYTQKAYYLASIADRIYMNPMGDFPLKGIGSQVLFLKNAMEKLDIEAEIIRHGKFKSAVEPWMQDRMSHESREQTRTYINAIWDWVADGIAGARSLDKQQMNEWIDRLEVFEARSAMTKGLLDGLTYEDEVLKELAEYSEAGSEENPSFVSLSDYIKEHERASMPATSVDKIAVIFAEGDIVMGSGHVSESITSGGLTNSIREARQDSSVKAIVLRINSGGGSALASEIISREVRLAADVKPVIASFGDVAASGGYYIATQADIIVADPTTITGSIGVFGIIPNFRNFMDKKLGLTFDGVTTHRYSDAGNPMRPLSAEERTILQKHVENIYDTFLVRVSTGRNMPKETVDEMGQGRVWSAVDAKRLGLIDRFGGLNEAVLIAAEKAGLTDYAVKELPERRTMLEILLSGLAEEAKMRAVRAETGEYYKYYRQLKSMAQMQGVQAKMPCEIELY
ncbi:MAG: signal peptide peptidase SppA [Bacteroidales bacterium]|jgi:protease-4|nr:signal peptide peptidase SppA [Bacteroidales bacterium]